MDEISEEKVTLMNSLYLDGDEIRSKEYVEQECRNLVDQIIDLIDKHYMHREDET